MKARNTDVPSGLVAETLSIAAARGLNIRSLLDGCAIDPSIARAKDRSICTGDYGRLWLAIATALDDEFFGQDSHPMRIGSYAAMTRAALCARDGEHALRSCVSFMRLVLDDMTGSVHIRDGSIHLLLTHRRQPPAMFAYATYFILVYGLICWLIDRRIGIRNASFACAEPRNATDYRLMFCDSIAFSAETTHIVLDGAFRDRPVVQTPKSATAFLRRAPGNFIAKYRRPDAFSNRIEILLRDTPVVKWPDAKAVAAALSVPASTLRRRLSAEGTSYQALKDKVRMSVALEMLTDSSLTVEDIAHRLGYAEPSSFYRMFSKSTGTSPGALRR